MNGLLPHTSCIHLGRNLNTPRSRFRAFFAMNVKSAAVFISSGFSTARSGVIGLINNIKL